MKYIAVLRHGEAEPSKRSDAERALTDKGILYSRAAAKTLHQQFETLGGLDAIYHSPFKRTTQTAHAVLATLESLTSSQIAIAPDPALLGENTPQSVCEWLDKIPHKNILLVSHQPLVSECLDWMIDANAASASSHYAFYPSSLAVLQTEHSERGCAELLSLNHHPAV